MPPAFRLISAFARQRHAATPCRDDIDIDFRCQFSLLIILLRHATLRYCRYA